MRLSFRRLTTRELAPFAGRPWIAWGPGRDPRSFRLDGISLHVNGHREPIVFVWSFASQREDDRGTPVFSHVPYPHALPEAARRAVNDLQSYEGGFDGFLRLLSARATRLE